MGNRNVCFLCDGELKPRWGYLVCEECKIVAPAVGDMINKQEIDDKMVAMCALRSSKSETLHILKQKQDATPSLLTKDEKEEIRLWTEHNQIWGLLRLDLENYRNKEIRQEKVYPLFYQYLLVSEEIEEFYSKQ